VSSGAFLLAWVLWGEEQRASAAAPARPTAGRAARSREARRDAPSRPDARPSRRAASPGRAVVVPIVASTS
jgi:hypothetical protein